MKVAFGIDFLLERTHEVFLLELLLAGFPDAEIYTFAHAQGKILGRIENHKIISSPLSRFVQSYDDLKSKAWMLPSVSSQLKVSADIEKFVMISSGWAHTIKTSPQCERFVWLYDFNPIETRLSGLKKVFNSHHQSVKLKSLKLETNLAFSQEALKKNLMFDGKIIYPGYKTDDYFVVPDETHSGNYPYHLVLLKNTDPQLVRELASTAQEFKVALKFAGPDDIYSDLKDKFEFVGDHCAATTAGMTHEARAVWCLGKNNFPAEALGAISCGRPAVVMDNSQNREFFPPEGGWFYQKNLRDLFKTVDRDFLSADKKQLRRMGLKFNERLFKNQMRAWCGLKPKKESDEA
jgi:hypothetical protein